MSVTSLELAAGQSVAHTEMGDGVIVAVETGRLRAGVSFEPMASGRSLWHRSRRQPSWEEQVVTEVKPATEDAVKKLWLAMEAEQLPLLESAATLTAAKVDLLPHQIILTYRVANADVPSIPGC